jgi:Mg2+-importing ATPase
MGISSNFGNMFSVAAATLFLPFLPMLPLQILVNNFLYDFSQLTIPSDNVDDIEVVKPRHWNLKIIQVYMIVFGITSSVFDFITFYLLYKVYHVTEDMFRTGWFVESLGTQVLVIYIIRTRRIPFLQSIPSLGLTLSTLACLAIGWIMPYSPIAHYLHFEPLPMSLLGIICLLVVAYLACAEVVKQLIYKRYISKIEH